MCLSIRGREESQRMHQVVEDETMNNVNSYDYYPNKIKNTIANRQAVAVADLSTDKHHIVAC